MGCHEQADTFDAVVSDYVTQRARELIRQADKWMTESPDVSTAEWPTWQGEAVEILRELTRDA